MLAGPEPKRFTQGSGRLELAEAIASPANPLLARVMANRVWQQHFGRGIVATPSNFGQLGERPTHPQLLDWLAAELAGARPSPAASANAIGMPANDRAAGDGRGPWSIKSLHRTIMLTDAYQRSAAGDPANEERDPENRYLWRMSRRRLTVEAFRDAALAAAGSLDRSPFGPSGKLDDVAFVRRTVYGKVSRHDLSPLLRLFDFPAPNITSDRRTETTVPQQALFLMNSPFMAARARELAARFADEPTPEARVTKAYRLAYARQPTAGELAVAVRYLSAAGAADAADAADAVKVVKAAKTDQAAPAPMSRAERFAQALLASSEFMFVD